MRLKSRTKFPAGGFQVLVVEAGMKAPFSGSFSEAVQFLYNFRRKNPALVQKHGWSTNIQDIEEDVDRYNAQRMVAAGYLNFVDIEGEAPIQKKTSSGLFRSVGAAAAKAKTALAIYTDMFGSSGTTVPLDEAERRASVCAACQMNDTEGGLKDYFVTAAAKEIMSVFGMLRDLDLKTSLDEKLGVCKGCKCPMKAKVWVDNAILKKNLSREDVAKLDPGCWIPTAMGLTETQQAGINGNAN